VTGFRPWRRPWSGAGAAGRGLAGPGTVAVSNPADLTPLPDLLHEAAEAGPVRTRRPVYVDLPPPCNADRPAGRTSRRGWALAQAGEQERALHQLTEDNPFPGGPGLVRGCPPCG
jgi:hypothetical protein